MARNQHNSLETLWRSLPTTNSLFQPKTLAGLPVLAQRYLAHAILPDTPLASAVRLKMHGKIKLKGWQSFQAEQVICRQYGMVWQATVWQNGLPIYGWDRLVAGAGAMQWKLLGIVPVMTAEGTDITRSAIGRMHGECIWLPSVFCHRHVIWTALDEHQIIAQLTDLGETTKLKLTLDEAGRLQQLSFKRWGNPAGAEYAYRDFGGTVHGERTFSGYTIPTQLRIGWHHDPDDFDTDGEFFRVTLDEAIYR